MKIFNDKGNTSYDNSKKLNHCILGFFLIIFIYLMPIYSVESHCNMPCMSEDDNNGCDHPGAFGSTRCVSRPRSSNYFNPQLRVCSEVCAFAICTCSDIVLSGRGECKYVWETIVPIRFCARAAAPGCIKSETDNNGNCIGHVDESPSYGNNKPRVRICAYQDPIDLGDTDGLFGTGYMPYHHNTPKPTGSDAATASKVLASSALVLLAVNPPLALLTGIAAGIAALFNVTTYNTWVVDGDGTHGCVEAPAGPPPPPFCPFYQSGDSMTPPAPSINRICKQNEVSTANSICVNTYGTLNLWGNTYSSFEQPLVRIGFDNFIPICSLDKTTKNCVEISTNGNNTDEIHNTYQDRLPICNESSSNLPCIKFVGYTPLSTQSSYRVVYYIPDGSLPAQTVTNWYQDPCDTPIVGNDCMSSSSKSKCQKINLTLYGVNDGNFYDIGYNFPNAGSTQGQTVNKGSQKVQPIIDTNNRSRTFAAKIDPNAPTQICVSEVDTSGTEKAEIGCFDRPPAPTPIIANCNQKTCVTPSVIDGNNVIKANQQVCIEASCTTTHMEPKMVVGLGMTQSSVQVSVVNMPSNPSNQENPMIILHGVGMNAYITNDTNDGPDQSGNLDQNDYYNPPLKTSACFSNDPCDGGIKSAGSSFYKGNSCCYTKGLRFLGGEYRGGGTKLCLINTVSQSQYVLSKMILDPTTNQNIISSLPTDVIINPYVPCQPICYDGRVVPPCPVSGCCDACSNPSCTGKPDIAKIVNNDKEGVRRQTSIEASLCADIPQLSCNEISSPGSDDGNATWAQGNAGDQVTGACVSGYAQSAGGPPTRICYAFGNKGVWGYVQNPCGVASCPKITAASANDGYASWDAIQAGQTQTGKCLPGYTLQQGASLTRPCNVNGSAAEWGTVSASCK